jgi:hypothetical protein
MQKGNDKMDDKLTVITSAFQSIKKFGWCCVGKSRQEEINIIVKTIKDCGEDCKVVELPNETIQIFLLK